MSPQKLDPVVFADARPAAQPGAHAPARIISAEYDEDIVVDQIAYLELWETKSVAEMQAHQLERLRDLLTHAGLHVPYWRELFRELAFDPKAIGSTDDLRKLPLLTKDMIKADYKAFIAENIDPDRLTYMTTGGSTGEPLRILMDREYRSRNNAATRYYLSKAGIAPGDRKSIRLHGNVLDDDLIRRGQFWLQEGTRLTMSVYHISPETTPAYIKAICDFEPEYVHAYASALSLLAGYAKTLGLSFPKSIENVFCDSETTYPWQRELIERMLDARLYNIYGHTEGAGLALSFPDNLPMEAMPHVGVMEIIGPKGNPITGGGQRGEIVVTGFNNRVMPFIRYRTFDIAILADVPDGQSRPFRPLLENVEGRIQDYVVATNGGLVPAAPALFDYNFDWSGIDKFQVFQETAGELEFRIVPNSDIGSVKQLSKRVQEGFSRIFGPDFSICVTIHKSIGFTSRGKYRYVDQRLNINV